MVGSRQAGGQGIARLLVLCAVLAGLFLMHGAPATAAEGCHGVMSVPMPVPAPADMGHETATDSMASIASDGHEVMTHTVSGLALPAAPVVKTAAASTGHGALCVSTPVRERAPLPVHALLTGSPCWRYGLLPDALWCAAVRGGADHHRRVGAVCCFW